MFVLTNGRFFIGTDSQRRTISVQTIERALCFDDKQRACNYLLNLPKEFRNIGYRCEEREEEVDLPQEEIISLKEIEEVVPKMEETFSKMMKQRDIIERGVHRMDAATIDLMHYAEFNSLNVVQGYKFYKKLREIRKKRREYKDLLRIINLFQGSSGNNIAQHCISAELELMKNREYEPRILKEIFTNENPLS